MRETHYQSTPRDTPIGQVAFGFQNAPDACFELDGLRYAGAELRPDHARLDLTLWVDRRTGPLRAIWTYRANLFTNTQIAGFHAMYAKLLRCIADAPENTIVALQRDCGAKTMATSTQRRSFPGRAAPNVLTAGNLTRTEPNWLGTPKAAMSSIITVQAWRTIPFATVIFLAGIASIPEEVDDAAAIDGATGLKKFWYVSLPLQLPIAIVAVLFGIIFTATDMVVPYILTNGGPFNSTQVLTTYAFQTGINAGNIGEGAAIALFMLPVLAFVAIGMLFFARRAEVT